jgi:hypothetical protein
VATQAAGERTVAPHPEMTAVRQALDGLLAQVQEERPAAASRILAGLASGYVAVGGVHRRTGSRTASGKRQKLVAALSFLGQDRTSRRASSSAALPRLY